LVERVPDWVLKENMRTQQHCKNDNSPCSLQLIDGEQSLGQHHNKNGKLMKRLRRLKGDDIRFKIGMPQIHRLVRHPV
jgi:hypothetical protein